LTSHRRPSYATIVDEPIFAFVTEHEIRTATRLRYPLSLLTVLSQIEGEDEVASPNAPTEELARALSSLIRATDLIRPSRDARSLQLLLVAAPLESLPGIIQRIAAEVHAHRFMIGGDLKSMTLSVGGSCFPATASSAAELVTRADRLAAQASRDELTTSRYRLR
jgi:hypothetical protein